LKILLLEPYFTGSHKAWAEGYQSNSAHDIQIISLPGKFWKWRMHGGAISVAKEFMQSDFQPDLIISTDMLDLTTFLSLTRSKTADIPIVLYFHENQITYPWSSNDRDVMEKRDIHYGFINIASALAADHILFNSQFHMDSFLSGGKKILKHFPDNQELDSMEIIQPKSDILYLGMDLSILDYHKAQKSGDPLILWNHRWEYDKNPESFFHLLYRLDMEGFPFEIAILGESFKTTPSIFDEAKDKLNDRIVHYGFCDQFKDYAQWLWKADILPVTSNQDFFGISIMEAIYCGAYPILPKRLTYPELLPEKYHDKHLYDNENELYELVKDCIQNVVHNREKLNGDWVRKYDWRTMVNEYDKLFSSYL